MLRVNPSSYCVNSDQAIELRAAAECAHCYLSEVDPLPLTSVDAVIGFGMFDVALASFCGELYAQARVRRIIFTGGVGAGTADLGKPEANAWFEQLAHSHPAIPPEQVILENRSTNTAENIAFTTQHLSDHHPDLTFGQCLKTALIVASPSRLRRVKLTLEKMQPTVRVFRCLPTFAQFDREYALYESKGLNYPAHLAGELERLTTYPARGWITPEPMPDTVIDAYRILSRTRRS